MKRKSGNDSDEKNTYIHKRKRSNRAMAHSLSDSIKPIADISISLYRALLANMGGFPAEGDEMRAAAKALAFASQTCKTEIEDDNEYNAITMGNLLRLICKYNLNI